MATLYQHLQSVVLGTYSFRVVSGIFEEFVQCTLYDKSSFVLHLLTLVLCVCGGGGGGQSAIYNKQ